MADGDTTPRGYPLPHPDQMMRDPMDPEAGTVMRMRRSIERIDADLEELEIMTLALGG